MTLYGYWRSSCSWRVRIVLAHKGLAHVGVPLHLVRDGGQQHGAAHAARNPMRQVPSLEVARPEGRATLSDSVAIMEYLEEVQPAPPLLPADPWLRAKVRQLVHVVAAGTQPLHNLAVLREVERLGGNGRLWAAHFIGLGLAALEQEAAALAGTCLVGDALSLADVCLVPQLAAAARFGVDLAAFPRCRRLGERLAQLPAFVAADAARQPDAEGAA